MKKVFLGICFTLIGVVSKAHSAKEAYFTIQETEQGITVTAEFPWALRNALLEFDSKLENAKSKTDFEKTLKQYISQNLILFHDEDTLLLLKIEEMKVSGHSHQSTFVLLYQGAHLTKITNTLMFSLSSEHVNYHDYVRNNNHVEFKTTLTKPSYTVIAKQTDGYNWGSLLFGLMVVITGVIVFWLKRKRHKN